MVLFVTLNHFISAKFCKLCENITKLANCAGISFIFMSVRSFVDRPPLHSGNVEEKSERDEKITCKKDKLFG